MAKKPKTPEAEGEEGEAKPGGVKGLLANKMVLIGLVGMLAAGIGGGAWMFLGKKKDAADPALEAAKAVQKRTGFVEMKEMLINISGSQAGERSNFIKLKVALEISDSKMAPEIQPLLPRIEDMFQVYLRELRPADLEGSAGTFRLKEELLRRANVAVHPAKIDAVLFKELLVQ